MINYAATHLPLLLKMTLEHLQIVSTAMSIAMVLASILTVVLLRFSRFQQVSGYLLSICYAIPSFALFALLIPFTGLGKTTAIIVLVFYAQYVLVRSFLSGIQEVDPSVTEAALGMGMTRGQILRKIQLPLAIPGMMAGIKVATTSTIAITTIGATINAGGLGMILFDGLRTLSIVKLSWGIFLTVGLSILFMLILDMIEELLTTKYAPIKS